MMSYLLKYSIHVYICLVILKLCTAKPGIDLRVICNMCDYYLKIDEIPKECTAVLEYTSFPECFPDVQAKRKSLPLILVVDSLDYDTKEKIKDMVKNANQIQYDIIVFDLFKIKVYGYRNKPLDFSKFIEEVKPKDGAGIGLLIQHDVNWYKGKFDFKTSNNITDIYLLQSIDYRDCIYHEHQADMPVLSTTEEVESSIKCLSEEMGVPFNKIIYEIDLRIESRKGYKFPEPMDFSYLCENKLSVERKYCFNTIQLLFDKARLRTRYNTMGILVQNMHYDDKRGSCGCTTASDSDPKFRGLKTIAGASQESEKPIDFYQCNQGEYPVIK